MERASTPRNRLTRSSAKQVNTPVTKTEKEGSLEHIPAEDIKQNLRKSRRKTLDFKPKTNGNSSTSVDGKKLKNIDDLSDGNSLDGCESEDSNTSMTQRNSPKTYNHKTPPSISKISLRTRRSITPGPDLESSASKKMTRSTSEGKLESLSTPIKRRSLRAKSESKDFVFTPSKTKSNDAEKSQSSQESNSNYNNKNSTVRVIDKILEASEEESSEDDVKLSRYINKSQKCSEVDNKQKFGDSSQEIPRSESQDLQYLSPSVNITEADKGEISDKISKGSNETLKPELQELDNNMSYVTHKTKGGEDIEANTELDNKTNELNKGEVLNQTITTVPQVIKETSGELCQESNQTVTFIVAPLIEEETSNEILQELNQTATKTPEFIEKPSFEVLKESNSTTNTTPEVAEGTSVEEQESNQTVITTPQAAQVTQEVLEESDQTENIKPQVVEEASDDVPQESKQTETVKRKIVEETSDNLVQEASAELQKSFEISNNNHLQCYSDDIINQDKDENGGSNDMINKEENGESEVKSVTKPLVFEPDKPHTSIKEKDLHGRTEESDIIDETNEECNEVIVNIESEHISAEISSGDGNNQPEEAQENVINMEISKDKSSIIQSGNNIFIENNNVRPLEEQDDNENLELPKKLIINVPETKSIEGSSRCVGSPIPADERNDEDSSSEDQGIVIPLTDSDDSDADLTVEKVIEHRKKTGKENIGEVYVSCEEESNQIDNNNCAILKEEKLNKNTEEVDESNIGLHSININSKHCDLIEDDPVMNDPNKSPVDDIEENDYVSNKIEENEGCSIQVVDPHTILNSDYSEVIHFSPQSNSEEMEQDPLGVDQSEHVQETNEHNENNKDEFSEKMKDTSLIEKETLAHKGTSKKACEPQSVNEYDHYMYEDGTSSKVDEDSEADSDIYKDMSDFESDKEGKKDGSQYDESISSEPDSGSNDSEDYAPPSSVEEEEENEKEHNQENVPSNVKNIAININKKIEANSSMKSGEKLFDTNSPMTYDKALAILNKDRVKKIDDEEFFDMFTQELNRVSEESGSDSDIAIVDEYILEPEETVKKPIPKPTNSQVKVKPPQRSLNPPPAQIPIQPGSQAEQYSGNYNQQAQAHHNHPGMQRMTQGAIYHQYTQGLPVNTIRGQVMYNQFGQPNTNIQDPRVFNPLAQPDVTYTRGGMYNPSFGPEGQMNYPNTPTLNVRSVEAMNSSQPCNNNTNAMFDFGDTDEPKTAILGISDPIVHFENQESRSITTNAATMTDKMASNSSSSSETSTPILKLLGLDKEKLKLLKKALGIENKPEKVQKAITRKRLNQMNKSVNILSPSDLPSNKMKGCIKKRHRTQKTERAKKKLLIKQILGNNYTLNPSTFEASSSTEHSSDETASSSDHIFPGTFHTEPSSSEESINKKREVNFEDDSVLITFKTTPVYKKQKNRGKKSKQNITVHSFLHCPEMSKIENKYKRTRDHIETVPESLRLPKKCKFDETTFSEHTSFKSMKPKDQKKINKHHKMSCNSVPECSKMKSKFDGPQIVESHINPKRKMTQRKKQNMNQSTIMRSNVGIFTVDPVTAPSHSRYSEVFTVDEMIPGSSDYLQELRRGVKRDIDEGRGKLSNLFRQHSLARGNKTSKKDVDEVLEKIEKSITKKKVKKLKKLPVKLLEQLVEEGEKSKNQLNESASDEEITVKKRRGRKRSSKVKVKSAALEKDYIPLMTSAATQFGLSRLDKDTMSAAARTAADFREEKLYGSTVKRITIMDFKG